MKAINPKEWIPADHMDLEDNAKDAITAPGNTLVMAGPGAGKTELLAQKSHYLLHTNVCRFPRKILAISFKRDAAFNLKERVRKRAGDALSRRFDSFTFDAFAKLIVDRFCNALPATYKIQRNYSIFFGDEKIKDTFRGIDLTYYSTHSIKNYDSWLTAPELRLKVTTDGDQE
jgi:DNA helicase-2/ATP-dependent DNA helicase PcrA